MAHDEPHDSTIVPQAQSAVAAANGAGPDLLQQIHLTLPPLDDSAAVVACAAARGNAPSGNKAAAVAGAGNGRARATHRDCADSA